MMQMLYCGEHPEKSSIVFLSMIDLDPNNPSCIFYMLNFVCCQAKKYDLVKFITFDNPLFWKAITIIQSEAVENYLKCIILQLCDSHR